MKAMVFAAGLGTRLRPYTDNLPKALVAVGGIPMLEIAIRRLKSAGVTGLVVNIHHFHEKITDFLRVKNNFGLEIALSREEAFPLETGGGLKKAEAFFDDDRPFFAYNSDVYSEMDLKGLYSAHLASGSLATLAVRDRASKRKFVFSAEMDLRGRQTGTVPPGFKPFAFSGIQVLSKGIFPKISETGVFSIAEVYLRLAAAGEIIKGFEYKSDKEPYESPGDRMMRNMGANFYVSYP